MPSGRCLPSGFGNVHATHRLGLVRLRPEFFRQFSKPLRHAVLLDVLERLAVHSRRSAVDCGSVARRSTARPPGTPCRTAHRSETWVLPSLWHATPSATSEPFRELVGSSPIPRSRAASCVVLELRPLRSTGVTRLHRYYEPLRHPTRPGLSLAGVRLGSHAATAGASRVASGFLVQTCHRHYPGGTVEPVARASAPRARACAPRRRPSLLFWQVGSRIDPFRGLLGVHSRYGLPARGIAKRPFPSKASAASLPPPPLRLLPAGTTSCRVGLAPTENQRLSRRTKMPRLRFNSASGIFRKANTAELPARLRRKEIAIRCPDMTSRRSTRSAAQHILIAHELAVVLAECTGRRRITGIGRVRTLRPLPDLAEHLRESLRRDASASTGWKCSLSAKLPSIGTSAAACSHSASLGKRPAPSRIGISLKIADMHHRILRLDWPSAA